MTKDEALQIPDLCIEVTPLVEDAFYAFRDIDDKELQARLENLPDDYVSGDAETDALLDKYYKDIEMSTKAMERFQLAEKKDRFDALVSALKMIENIEKYGVACADWIFT